MDIQDIVLLEEAAQDMLDGKAFYDTQTLGIGNYFWDSLMPILNHFTFMQAFTNNTLVCSACSQNAFPTLFIIKSLIKSPR
jgi:hypothetical protein